MKRIKWLLTMLGLVALASSFSQVTPPIRRGTYRGREVHYPTDPRQFRGWRNGGQSVPIWEVSATLPKDVFTFARLCYPFRRNLRWTADYPEAELNFSWRLHQLTSLQVNPYPVIVDLDAEQMRHHPFLYISEPSNMNISDEQARLLREYMLNGGFILLDDFWGADEWRIFSTTLKRIWPDRAPVDLKPEHPIFHCVFDLKEPPQAHSNAYWSHVRKGTPNITSNETRPDAAKPIFRAVHDDRGRMVMLLCLNNDLGDGWEQESFDPDYFREVSEKYAYPIGINIVFYALTH